MGPRQKQFCPSCQKDHKAKTGCRVLTSAGRHEAKQAKKEAQRRQGKP